MSTITVPKSTSTTVPAAVKVAAGIALPLGLMNIAGAIIFSEWSWMVWVGVWGAIMGAATLIGAVQTLAGRANGRRLLASTMIIQLVFTAMKLVFWQELEAAPFGVAALAIYLVARERPAPGRG